jgi:hypothetical protein
VRTEDHKNGQPIIDSQAFQFGVRYWLHGKRNLRSMDTEDKDHRERINTASEIKPVAASLKVVA